MNKAVGPDAAPLPDEGRHRDRRILRFELIAEPPAERDLPVVVTFGPARTGCGRRWHVLAAARSGRLWLTERVLGDRASTLRTALLVLVGFAGAIVFVGVAFGLGGLVLGGSLGVVLYGLIGGGSAGAVSPTRGTARSVRRGQ